ncbi:MAG: cation:proton antiporter [Gemmataceae bacterium]|nr:cation:proton antiporter [Gemmataceae bacterium]
MHNIDLILTLTGALTAALVLGYFTQRIGLSPIVGYLLAGIVVGPHTWGFEADRTMAEQLGEVGVILLMFGVGLQFHLKELLAVRRIAIPGAVFQSAVATLLGVVAAWGFGWTASAGLVYGMAISVASTVVLVRVLADHGDLHTPTGHIAVGWLVVEDLFTVVILVLLPALFGNAAGGVAALPMVLLLTALKIAAMVAVTFIVGSRLIPWLLHRVDETRTRELFTLTVLVVALGIAVGSTLVFGVSMALGAFLAGMVVGRSDFSLRAATEALPMRDAFAVLFFVSTGMLFNPRFLLEAPGLVAATLGIVLIGKPLAALAIVLFFGYPMRVAFSVAVALAQIGEFTFMLASVGRVLGVLPESATNALVAAAIVSIAANPLLYRLVGPLERWLDRRAKSSASPRDVEPDASDDLSRHRAVIIGFGPVGRTLSRLLDENEIEPTIVELNLETVHMLRKAKTAAVYGDATHQDVLKAAGIEKATSLFLSSSGMSNAEEIIRMAKTLNPKIRVIARCAYLREVPSLRKAGADGVYAGEGEVALAMTEAILRRFGAVPDQIDRERDRVRTDLFGNSNDDGKATVSGGMP